MVTPYLGSKAASKRVCIYEFSFWELFFLNGTIIITEKKNLASKLGIAEVSEIRMLKHIFKTTLLYALLPKVKDNLRIWRSCITCVFSMDASIKIKYSVETVVFPKRYISTLCWVSHSVWGCLIQKGRNSDLRSQSLLWTAHPLAFWRNPAVMTLWRSKR